MKASVKDMPAFKNVYTFPRTTTTKKKTTIIFLEVFSLECKKISIHSSCIFLIGKSFSAVFPLALILGGQTKCGGTAGKHQRRCCTHGAEGNMQDLEDKGKIFN